MRHPSRRPDGRDTGARRPRWPFLVLCALASIPLLWAGAPFTVATLSPLGAAGPAAAAAPGGWNLVFADEFGGAGLDRAKWQTAYPWGARNNAGNNELQYYADDALSAANGALSIRADRRALGGFNYTSGLISSYGSFAATYGYFEVRAKLPRGKGYWPAFWLSPADYRQWPPEIDVFEAAGDQPNTVTMTYHYKDGAGAAQQTNRDYTGPDFTAGFHTFAVGWSPGLLVWYVDGVERFRTTTAVAAQPMYVMANLALDGKNPPDATTPFPATMDIDYIHVYAGGPPGTTPAPVSPGSIPGWSDWASRGGVLTDSPAAASFGGRAYAFARGTGAALYAASSADGQTWTGWQNLGGILTAAPTAADYNGRLYAFARGTDNALYVDASGDGAGWSGWRRLGGLLTSAPTAASTSGGLYVFARGSDGGLYVTSSTDGTTFSAWRPLGGALTSAPAAASLGNTLYVFARGTGNALYVTRSTDGATWSAWQNLGGNLTDAPAAAGAGGTLSVLARGSDGALWERHSADGTGWSAWQGLGGRLVGPPAAAGLNQQLVVVVRSGDNALWERHSLP
ncbi:MAG TPA: family 16 glycosylhydrolase [Thermomicrobiales bacterium]|nr:family 16 glycosylhydrolase [Thermomicrobiales bacterium]